MHFGFGGVGPTAGATEKTSTAKASQTRFVLADATLAMRTLGHPTSLTTLSYSLPGTSGEEQKGKVQLRPYLSIRKEGEEFELHQLSDGERGILAIVLDLTRRIALVYQDFDDPLAEAEAFVVIDEIDLHLHPGWQRDILPRLKATFPKCQFILTTHSPQVIGEVQADNLIYLQRDGENIEREMVGESFGRDVNHVISQIMDTPIRNSKTQEDLKQISALIQDAEFEQAQEIIDRLRQSIGDEPELDRAEVRMDILEDLE